MVFGTKRGQIGLLVASACLVLTGCGDPAASVLIDNTNDAAMTVEVNGIPATTIEARSYGYIQLAGGSHHFLVKLGGKEVYNGMRSVEQPEGLLGRKTYLFNPTMNAHYAICDVKYGEESYASQAVMAAVLGAAEAQHGKVDPIRKEFVETKRLTKTLPAEPFFPLKGAYYKLRQPPESLLTKNGRMEVRSVLTRISEEDHGYLARAHAVQDPTQDDLNLLEYATDQVFSSLDLLDPLRM